MVIEGSDYRLTPIKDSYRFDLEILSTINKGKSNERTEFKNLAYGVNLENAMRYIIAYRINNKYNEDIIDLRTYIQEYKKLIEVLHKELNL